MSLVGQSFLSSAQLSEKDIEQIFSRAELFRREFEKNKRFDHLVNDKSLAQKTIALVFAEASTRTRLSFQVAAGRLGMKSVVLDNPTNASLSKGETLEDTFLNVAAMWPDLMVVRYNVNQDADATIGKLPCPVINGGIGTSEHPTQALADAFTILAHRKKIKGEKILIIGDVLHSRVANSNLMLLKRLGAEVGYCAPAQFEPDSENWRDVCGFTNLEDGVRWATVIMGLRVQKERHQSSSIGFSLAEYRERFRLGTDQMDIFVKDGIVLHPGPVIRGIEFSAAVMNDPRCKVLEQVTSGVFVRASLMSLMLGLEVRQA